jgi:hypothetical protein
MLFGIVVQLHFLQVFAVIPNAILSVILSFLVFLIIFWLIAADFRRYSPTVH